MYAINKILVDWQDAFAGKPGSYKISRETIVPLPQKWIYTPKALNCTLPHQSHT